MKAKIPLSSKTLLAATTGAVALAASGLLTPAALPAADGGKTEKSHNSYYYYDDYYYDDSYYYDDGYYYDDYYYIDSYFYYDDYSYGNNAFYNNFPDAVDVGGDWYYTSLGYVWTGYWPWVYFDETGSYYWVDEAGDWGSMNLYSAYDGWVWTSYDYYPEVYFWDWDYWDYLY